MGELWKNNNCIVVVLFATVVLVQSLPTSVLVESKQTHPGNTKGEANNAELAEKQPEKLVSDAPKPKLTPQKRGVNPSFYGNYGRDLSNDIAINNNVPRGVWEDTESNVLYPELQDYEDYSTYAYPSSVYHPKPYENLQNILSSSNYDEPEPVPVPIRYPYARYLDDRRKRSAPRHIMRLKRNSANKKPVDMVSLIAMLEAKERARLNEDAEKSHLYDYPRSPYLRNNDDELAEDKGEWWNGYIEPNVQYYESPYRHIGGVSQYAHNRPDYPTQQQRFMVAKKKRSLSPREIRNAMSDHQFADSAKPYFISGFDNRYNPLKNF